MSDAPRLAAPPPSGEYLLLATCSLPGCNYCRVLGVQLAGAVKGLQQVALAYRLVHRSLASSWLGGTLLQGITAAALEAPIVRGIVMVGVVCKSQVPLASPEWSRFYGGVLSSFLVKYLHEMSQILGVPFFTAASA
ncbi:hypothetical protein E2C01_036439 [Portunus trituberculatus]|uniref:Uncharacterized protein n=1 Tax=Portunus trituberculatus TaxID=210409 RepID=A0A5B7FCG8_PORTR|nr:hypothetical protein [Portunus trituberculatus]